MASIPEFVNRLKPPKRNLLDYFSLADKDPTSERMKLAFGFGIKASAGIATLQFYSSLANKPDMVTALYKSGRMFGIGMMGVVTHAAIVSSLGTYFQSNNSFNHLCAGAISGYLMAYNTKLRTTVCVGLAIASYIGKEFALNDVVLIPDRSKSVSKELGIYNPKLMLTLNHQYMNPKWKMQEDELDKYL